MNQYEQAFGSWLSEQKLQFVSVGQKRRALFVRSRIKSFDFLVYPNSRIMSGTSYSSRNAYNSSPIIVEVKGRLFKGSSFSSLKNVQCWTTMEDIQGLGRWEDAFEGPTPYKAFFVFAFRFQNPFVEIYPYKSYEYDGEKYCFLAVSLDDYKKNMKVRSQSWQTVMISADDFRSYSIPAERLFCGTYDNEANNNTDRRVCT